MGLSDTAYFIGWLLFNYIKIFFVAIVTLGTIYNSSLYVEDQFFELCVAFTIYLIASVHQTFMMTSFFNNPKLAGEIGTFVLSLTSLFYFLLTFKLDGTSDTVFFLVCLLP